MNNLTRASSFVRLGQSHCRRYKSFFVTTPIYYVNAKPHLGHLYTTYLADALARWRRLSHDDVFFTTGTDEHGQKVEQAACKMNVSPTLFCDKIAGEYKRLFQLSGIAYDEFIRTTEERHKLAVEAFWDKLANSGHLYWDNYEGWYSTADECFYSENEVVQDTASGTVTSKETGSSVIWASEKNCMFRLADFKERLLRWLDSGVVFPSIYEASLRTWLDNIPHLSISRPKQRVSWGLTVPDCPEQTIYVWLDALINYLTVAGYPDSLRRWPPDLHIVGKDILKFHAIFWPALLMATELELPRKILCHSHWLVGGVKMSKSVGNILDPVPLIRELPDDSLRYFLLRTATIHENTNYSDRLLIETCNAELANTLGNLLSRLRAKSFNPNQTIPSLKQSDVKAFFDSKDQEILDNLESLASKVTSEFESYHLRHGIGHIIGQLHLQNQFIDKHKPWNMKDDISGKLNAVLAFSFEALRISAILLQPIVPKIAERLLYQMNVSPNNRRLVNCRILWDQERLLQENDILFKKLKI